MFNEIKEMAMWRQTRAAHDSDMARLRMSQGRATAAMFQRCAAIEAAAAFRALEMLKAAESGPFSPESESFEMCQN